MPRAKKTSDLLANVKTLIDRELKSLMAKSNINDLDKDFLLRAFKVLSDEAQAKPQVNSRPYEKKEDDILLDIINGNKK